MREHYWCSGCLMCLQVTDRDECVHVVAVLKGKRLLTGRRLMILLVGTPSPGRLFMTSCSSFKSKPSTKDAKKKKNPEDTQTYAYMCVPTACRCVNRFKGSPSGNDYFGNFECLKPDERERPLCCPDAPEQQQRYHCQTDIFLNHLKIPSQHMHT